MKTKPFARRVIALVAVIGLAACQAANASPPPDPALIALDSGQKLLQKEFVQDTGQATIVATAVTEKVIIGTAANTAPIKELDTSPPIGGQLAIISGALGIDANLDTGQPTAGYAGYQALSP